MKLTTLETRRKRGDLIQFYKALKRLDQIKWTKELSMIERRVNVRNGRFCFHRVPYMYGKGPVFHKKGHPSLE